MADYAVNLLGNDLPYDDARRREEELKIFDYQDWRVNDVLEFFGITETIEGMIDNATSIYTDDPHSNNENGYSENADTNTQEE